MTAQTETMRAAVYRGPGRIEVERIPLDEPGPGEVRVRVLACGVCGTDLHLFHLGPPPGHTPGHEIAGEVAALGDGVSGVGVGDRVAVEPLWSCGSCPECRAGRDSICREVGIFGIHRRGGMAEFVSVPAHRVYRVPDHLNDATAALAEPLAVAIHGLRLGGIAAGQRVLVVGAGAIGLLGVLAARALGAGEVWLTARHPHQAELGRALGASRVLGEQEAGVGELAQLGRDAPIDLALETVGGQANTLDVAAAAVRPGGRVSVLGLFLGRVSLEPTALLVKEVTLTWSNCYARPGPETDDTREADFETAIRLLGSHHAELGPLLTHSVGLDDVATAFEQAGDKRAGAVKVTLLP